MWNLSFEGLKFKLHHDGEKVLGRLTARLREKNTFFYYDNFVFLPSCDKYFFITFPPPLEEKNFSFPPYSIYIINI